jgi:hypothetical protein
MGHCGNGILQLVGLEKKAAMVGHKPGTSSSLPLSRESSETRKHPGEGGVIVIVIVIVIVRVRVRVRVGVRVSGHALV